MGEFLEAAAINSQTDYETTVEWNKKKAIRMPGLDDVIGVPIEVPKGVLEPSAPL